MARSHNSGRGRPLQLRGVEDDPILTDPAALEREEAGRPEAGVNALAVDSMHVDEGHDAVAVDHQQRDVVVVEPGELHVDVGVEAPDLVVADLRQLRRDEQDRVLVEAGDNVVPARVVDGLVVRIDERLDRCLVGALAGGECMCLAQLDGHRASFSRLVMVSVAGRCRAPHGRSCRG